MSNEVEFIKGTPTPLMMRAAQWKWKHVAGPFSVDLDISGTVNVSGDPTPKKFSTASFNVSEDIDVRIDFGTIVKLLFATSLYPNLEENQVFTISDVLLHRGGNKLTIVGNVLEQLE